MELTRRGLAGDASGFAQELTAEQVHAIFKRISDEDCVALGLTPSVTRPDWLLITALPVPPLAVRPSVQMSSAARSEDDLTHVLSDIIRANNNLRRQQEAGAPPHVISEFTSLLQFHIICMMDNTIAGYVSRSRGGGCTGGAVGVLRRETQAATRRQRARFASYGVRTCKRESERPSDTDTLGLLVSGTRACTRARGGPLSPSGSG